MRPRCRDSKDCRSENGKRKLGRAPEAYSRSEVEQRPRLKQREGEIRAEGIKLRYKM